MMQLCCREMLMLRSSSHPDRSITLAFALDRRFCKTGQIQDVDEEISLYREVLALRPILIDLLH